MNVVYGNEYKHHELWFLRLKTCKRSSSLVYGNQSLPSNVRIILFPFLSLLLFYTLIPLRRIYHEPFHSSPTAKPTFYHWGNVKLWIFVWSGVGRVGVTEVLPKPSIISFASSKQISSDSHLEIGGIRKGVQREITQLVRESQKPATMFGLRAFSTFIYMRNEYASYTQRQLCM